MHAKVNPWMISTLVLIGLVVGFGVAQLPALGASSKGSVQAERPAAAAPVVAPEPEPFNQPSGEITLAPVSPFDHVRGPVNAKVTLVEFSDTECPFCKRFHSTMKQLLEKYPNDVRWVYRHFPLDELHSKARKEAEATECANELGGQEKFWAYIDRLLEVTPSNDGLDLEQLPVIAQHVGLNKAQFEACLKSGRHAQRVADHANDGQNAGARGTPYSVLIGPDGTKYPVSGALPLEKISKVIDQMLGK